jgi:Fe-Mn family superoxide dismutase
MCFPPIPSLAPDPSSSQLLALDMYEHAYAMDYVARAAAYVDAFMATINWRFADGLYARASA